MFNNNTGKTEEEHFAVVLDAPCFICRFKKKLEEDKKEDKGDKEFNIMKTNVHLSAGALGKIVDPKLHSAIIGCTHGMRLDPDKDLTQKDWNSES